MKPMSRRSFLYASAGYVVSLPLLEAMLPSMAFAQSGNTPKRFVTSFAGTVCGPRTHADPGAFGALPSVLPASWKALEPVKDLISIVSNCDIPIYNNGTTPTAPASAINQQHGTTPAVLMAGVTSTRAMPVMVNGETVDQVAARAIGGGTHESIQLRVQALPYNSTNNEAKGIISARSNNGQLTPLRPYVSPSDIYTLLFGNGVSTPAATDHLTRRKSVLDLVLGDANRLKNKVSAADKVRLEQHFEEIRKIERAIAASSPGVTAGSCSPTAPGADPALGSNQFSGYSSETQRGELMADMIAYALACDVTRVVSWMLTFDQVFMGNAVNGSTDMHEDSHNIDDRKDQVAANANWHSALFARLVSNLQALPEGAGTVLDNTFLNLMFAEGQTAHSRRYMKHVVAGCGSSIRLGQHIDAGLAHPTGIQVAGLQAVGVNTDTLGEHTGAMTAIMR